MQILNSRWFQRFARRENLVHASLCEAIERAERGLIDADLGGGLIKQRIARPGAGRSGGYRTIIAYRQGSRAIYLYGFAKNELDNIAPHELDDLRAVGQRWLTLTDKALAIEIGEGTLHKVKK